MQQRESWKIVFACSRAEGEALAGDIPALEGFDPPPLLVSTEADPARPDAWRLEAYVDGAPDEALIAALRAMLPHSPPPLVERIVDADWVTISQAWLEPIRIGRFYVHTAAHGENIPADAVSFRIEAARAFGTGHHETTTGCLELLDLLARDGLDYADIADIGTGTGLLAFAARALWPGARVLASDLDPVSLDVTAENMAINAIPDTAIALVVADGVDHPAIRARAPFDLLVANILAGPLIALAPSLSGVTAPGATVILAGLLVSQEQAVLAAFARNRLDIFRRLQHGDWPILALRKRA